MNGRHDHTTAVCVSLRWSGGLHVVRLPAGSWHGLPRWQHGLCVKCVVSCGSTSFPWLVIFLEALSSRVGYAIKHVAIFRYLLLVSSSSRSVSSLATVLKLLIARCILFFISCLTAVHFLQFETNFGQFDGFGIP